MLNNATEGTNKELPTSYAGKKAEKCITREPVFFTVLRRSLQTTEQFRHCHEIVLTSVMTLDQLKADAIGSFCCTVVVQMRKWA